MFYLTLYYDARKHKIKILEKYSEFILRMNYIIPNLLHCCTLSNVVYQNKHLNHTWCITKEMCKIISCNVYFHSSLNDNLQLYIIKRNIVVVHVLWAISKKSSAERQLLETCSSCWNSIFYLKVPVSKASPRLTYNNQLQRSHYTIVTWFWNKFICPWD